MKNFNFQAMLKHGFLIIPKALLQQQIEDRHSTTTVKIKTACVKEAKACLVIATGATSSTGLSEKPSGSYTSLPRWEL